MTKLYKVKSSATRTAKKDFGDDWKNQGCLKQDDAGMWFFELTINNDQLVEETKDAVKVMEQKVLEEKDDADQGAPIGDPADFTLKVSTIEKPCSSTWDIAIEMNKQASEANCPAPKRKEVIEACVRCGVAYNTARTQYQAWFKANNG